MSNYDASQVGVPYTRVHRIEIQYPDNGQMPSATLHQSLAVKMADGKIRRLEDLSPIGVQFDFSANGSTPIPLVSPDTGAALGPTTTLNMVMLSILAVVRQAQIAAGG